MFTRMTDTLTPSSPAAGRHTLFVGQAGGPTPVINSSLAGIIRAARAAGYQRILGLRYGIRGLLREDFIDLTHLDEATLEQLSRTPSSALGACRLRLTAPEIEQCLATLARHAAHTFLYIGGNDSADTSHRIAQAAAAAGDPVRVLAVPKTMDNDLPSTDHCPGYGSVARYVAVSTLETTLDTRAMPETYPVKVMELMGRYAGWIVAAAALARTADPSTPHLIYVPERPFVLDSFLADVERCMTQDGHAVIVISENIRDAEGNRPSGNEALFVDPFGHAYYPGPAETLCRIIGERLDIRARFDKPGTLQRMSSALRSEVDRVEAEEAGRAAVQAALEGVTDCMVCFERAAEGPYRVDIVFRPLSGIANTERRLPDEFISPEGNNITDAFIEYALPLIGEPLPRYVRF
jgi:6-phosphofructokinase 1